MRKVTAIAALLSAMMALPSLAPAGRAMRTVESIEFRGLKLLNRQKLLEGVPLKAADGGITLDVEALRRNLEQNRMIEASQIAESGRGLVVTVKERVPVYLMAVRRDGETVPFEVDGSFNVVSVRDLHLEGKPLVIIRGEELKNGAISAKIREFFREMSRMEMEHRGLFAEIDQISLENDNMLEIFLKGRKTTLYLKKEGASFTALKYLLSILDERNYYPGTLRVGGGYGLIE